VIIPIGPLVNALTVVCGGLLGLAVGSRLPDRIRGIVFQGLGLCTLVIGMKMALTTEAPVILIMSVLLGGLAGEAIRLEDRLLGLGDKLKGVLRSRNPRFTEGLINASVLFCIGAMAILGSIDEGLRGDRTIVYSKSVMDCFAAVAMASAYGVGVIFAFIPVLLYQGALVLFAGVLQPWLGPDLIRELQAAGGVLILGIGVNLLGAAQIRLSNLLPALVIVVGLALFFL
jgi:uncharacterized membrane protein YqgA involved in biofilm formation